MEETAQAEQGRPLLEPNMLVLNANATSSTFQRVNLDHCVLSEVLGFNSQFDRCSFEGSTFQGVELDGSVFENSSFRGVELRNCDTEGLIVNGVNVGALLKLLLTK
ncbi:MAG TPA: pentapeptide repeat-containing protein [Solirubrobacteraceae bacterium]|jgi:uncharacterized protein YjbI with pentapeptide repeats|nr:pentapeptide repeat-containing protein [Solirubrobacteraceae bacterium]